MSAAQAGLVQSGWHAGYLVSLFVAGMLTDRLGARRTFLLMSVAACVDRCAVCICRKRILVGSGLVLRRRTRFRWLLHAGPCADRATLWSAEARHCDGLVLAAASFGYAVSLIACAVLSPWAGWRAGSGTVGRGHGRRRSCWVGWRCGVRAKRLHMHTVHMPWMASARQLWHNEPAQLAIWSYSFHCWELLGMWAWLPAFLVAAAAHGGDLSGIATSAPLAIGVGIAGV